MRRTNREQEGGDIQSIKKVQGTGRGEEEDMISRKEEVISREERVGDRKGGREEEEEEEEEERAPLSPLAV